MKQPAIMIALVMVLGLPESLPSAAPSDHNAKIDPAILSKLARGESQFDVIVVLAGYEHYVAKVRSDNPYLLTVQQAEIGSAQNDVLNKILPSRIELRHLFENILGFSGRASKAGIQELASLPEVIRIEEDGTVYAHLAQAIPLMNASAARSLYDGTGVSIAVVDTGIDYNHPMLGGGGFPNDKIIGGYDFGGDAPDFVEDFDPLDCRGHGTSVAGIAAGLLSAGPGDYIGGVAHNAKLYALKIVSGCNDWAHDSDIIKAWDWAVTHKYDDPANPILIINTSFGSSSGYTSLCDSDKASLAAAADTVEANGMTLFGSSGNNGYVNGISSPACVSSSISVGAVYDAYVGPRGYTGICTDSTTAADKVACYSNSASFLDLLAPGHDAYTTRIGGGYTSTFGGTSAASPYAAGIGALVQSYGKYVTGAYYSPAELKTRLSNGDLITDSKNSVATPRVNADTALFGPCLSPARVTGTSTLYFDYLQDAIDNADAGDVVEVQDYIFVEDILINDASSIIFRAGFDCSYSTNAGITAISGNVTINSAAITLESGILKIQE